ncbi:MAG: single-stranded DNA-binding protein [Clostridia bacterium]|nr:single-stranded DNA-binding protein [Clostridia bacterium]
MINSVVLLGRLTADPELRTTMSGKSVCTFRLAVDRSYVRQGEQRQADFINCVAWGQTADFVGRYFSKGSMIAAMGSIQTRTFEDKNGQKRTAVEVNVREASFTGETGSTVQTFPPAAQDFEEIDTDAELPV